MCIYIYIYICTIHIYIVRLRPENHLGPQYSYVWAFDYTFTRLQFHNKTLVCLTKYLARGVTFKGCSATQGFFLNVSW